MSSVSNHNLVPDDGGGQICSSAPHTERHCGRHHMFANFRDRLLVALTGAFQRLNAHQRRQEPRQRPGSAPAPPADTVEKSISANVFPMTVTSAPTRSSTSVLNAFSTAAVPGVHPLPQAVNLSPAV